MLKFIVPARTRRRALKAIRPSRAAELWYKVELLRIVKLIESQTGDAVLPILKSQEHTWLPNDRLTTDGIIADLDAVFTSLARRFTGLLSIGRTVAREAAARAQGHVDASLQRTVKSRLGVDITGLLSSHRLGGAIEDMVANNVSLIKSIPEQYLYRVQQVVAEGVAKGFRADDIAKTISNINDITENRARLIARDQISKMNAAINQIRQVDAGIEKYEWQTAGDERVRPTHKAHDGKIFEWSDPPEDTGHPGFDINCRCVAIPIFQQEEE